jgi:diguanylate cyclase (GGDEF)-like protein
MEGLSLDEALDIAERMRRTVNTTLIFEDQEIHISASFGVAMFDDSTPIEDVLAKGDRALYRAKLEGRNRVKAQSAKAPPRDTPPSPPAGE